MTIDWRDALLDERNDLFEAINIDGLRVAQAIDDRPGIKGRVYSYKREISSRNWYFMAGWWRWLLGYQLKMHRLCLKRPLYLGADGGVYRKRIDIHGNPFFVRARIEKRKTPEGLRRVHEAILRLAE